MTDKNHYIAMEEQLVAFENKEISLKDLCDNLQGLWQLTTRKDEESFRKLFSELDMELELRTEKWAPPDSASDERLFSGIKGMHDWLKNQLSN